MRWVLQQLIQGVGTHRYWVEVWFNGTKSYNSEVAAHTALAQLALKDGGQYQIVKEE